MASLRVLVFNHEGRPVAFDTWHDDLHLYLLSDIKDSVSLFDHVSGVTPAPPATGDGGTRSQWLSRDTTARLAIRNHLPVAECTHFGQHRTAHAQYDAVVARYSSPATTALGRLLLPYLFPELSAFAIVADLVTHLHTSDARHHATVPTEFLATNQPSMFITLYFIVSRLPNSLRSVRDHFLSLETTSLTVDLSEQHLLVAKTSAVAVGAACGTLRPPFFEGCSPSPLSLSFASAAAADVSVTEDVGAASTSVKRRSSKGKVGRGGGGGSGGRGGGSGGGGGGSGGGGGGSGVGGGGGTGGGRRSSGGGGGGSGGSGGSGGGETGGGRSGPRRGGPGGGPRQQQQRRSETQSPERLREWLVQCGTGGGSETCPYVIRTGVRAGQTCGKFPTEHRCFSHLDNAWRAEFGDDVERPRWANLLRSGVAIFDLDYNAIISAMYALSFSAEGDCYRCEPPDPGIVATALGASASGTPPGTAPAEAFNTFTLDSSASRFLAYSSSVLSCPVVPFGSLSGLHLPSFSMNLVSTAALQDAMVTTTTPGGQRVTICTCTRTGRHLATFTRRPGSSLYTLATKPPQVAASAQVSASRQVAASCSCRLLSHQTLLWHHRLGHPSLPRLRGMHSWFLVSGLPRSLPPLLPSPAPPSLLLISPEDCSPADSPHGRLRERFGTDLRLHSDRGGEFSSDLLREFCPGKGILQSFTLPASSQQNGIAEHRIGLVMEVARTSMIHAAAPHFQWPFAVRYAAHQLNLWPRVSLPQTSPTLRWTGKVGDASVFRVWVSRAFVRDTSADKLSACAIPCVFLHFFSDAPGWQFYHPTSRCVLPSQDVTFDESIPFHHLFFYPSAPPPPPPLFLAPGPPPVDPLPPQAVSSGAAPGAASGGAASGGAEPRGAGSEGAGSGGAEPGGGELEGPASASPQLSLQQLREWLVRREHRRSGAPGVGGAAVPAGAGSTGGAAATGPEGARTSGAGAAETGGVGCARAGDPTKPGAAGAGGARARGAGVGDLGAGGARVAEAGVRGTGAGGARPGGAGAVDPGGGGARGTVRPRPYFVPLLQQVLGVPSSTGIPPPFLCPPPDQSPAVLQSVVSLCLVMSRLFALLVAFLVRFLLLSPSHTQWHSVLPLVHFVFLCLLLLSPLFLSDPSFESAAASALVVELLDFAAACVCALVAESVSGSPPSVGGECALGTDVLEDRQEDFECLVAASQASIVNGMWIFRVKRPPGSLPAFKASYVDYFQTFSPTPKMTTLQMLLHVAAQRDYKFHSLEFSIAFLQGSVHEEIWLRRPPGFTGTFPEGTQTTLAALGFAPSTADSSLFLRTDTSLLPLYVLVYVDDLVFAIAHIEALTLVKSELQKRHTCTDLGELHNYFGLQITRDRAWHTITPTQSHMVHQVLQRFGFQFSLPQPTPLSTRNSLSAPPSDESVEPSGPYPEPVGCLMYLMTCTRHDLAYPLNLLARYVAPDRHRKVLQRFGFRFSLPQSTPLPTGHSLSGSPSDKSVEPSGSYPELVGCLITLGMGLMLGGRGLVVLTGHADASWVDDFATQRSSQGYTFSLGSGSVSWQSTRLSSVLSSSCGAEIYAGAMAAQELRWLTYLLTDMGERPRSSPLLYVGNKAMIALW
ncbi:unnamed protein product [Closterium sp. NIES-53]